MSSIPGREEDALIKACAEGGPDSWGEFLERYGRIIRATAHAVRIRVRARQCEVEDLASNVYEKLLEDRCRRLRLWRGEAKFSTYLVQVTKNLCIDYIRRHNRDYQIVDINDIAEWPDHSARLPCDDVPETQLETLKAEIEKLPAKQAMIMKLRLQGKSLREIADMLNTPIGTVSVTSSRAIHGLRAALDVEGPADGNKGASPES